MTYPNLATSNWNAHGGCVEAFQYRKQSTIHLLESVNNWNGQENHICIIPSDLYLLLAWQAYIQCMTCQASVYLFMDARL